MKVKYICHQAFLNVIFVFTKFNNKILLIHYAFVFIHFNIKLKKGYFPTNSKILITKKGKAKNHFSRLYSGI